MSSPADPDDETRSDGVGDWASNPYASRMVEYTPYAVALGMKFVSSSAGRGEILLPWREDLVGQDGTNILAPGVLTALIDPPGPFPGAYQTPKYWATLVPLVTVIGTLIWPHRLREIYTELQST